MDNQLIAERFVVDSITYMPSENRAILRHDDKEKTKTVHELTTSGAEVTIDENFVSIKPRVELQCELLRSTDGAVRLDVYDRG